MTEETYDYVIVGAGTAGCILANRLSANRDVSVLLLEAGGKDISPWIHVPVGYFKTMHDPKTDWCYRIEPDPGLNGRSIAWPRGKVLGGSSSINGLLYVRGQKEDYDSWAKLGNAGWSFQDILPYFIKCEDQQRGESEYHGVGGNLKVSDMRVKRQICEAFIAGAAEIGIPATDDFNGANQEGAGYYQLTTRNGLRCSTATGYLRQAKSRSNLKIVTNALTRQIQFEGNRATGVKYSRSGAVERAVANREILLCAGAINSPQLLMLSGVGEAAHLREFAIPVVKDLPGVGGNLHDHLQIRAVYRCNVPTLNNDIRNPLRKALIGLQYIVTRKGPMTMAASQVGIFTRTEPDLERPDIQFHFQPLSSDSPGEGVNDFAGITSSITQLRPESRGSIRLKSADPEEYPAIHANYLDAQLDQQVVIKGMRISRQVAASGAMSKYVVEEKIPGEAIQSDEELLDCARSIGETIYHPVSTCKMGPKSDSGAVVDERLRVYGLDGLRVVDGSIMPVITSGNTNAPIAAIAEKAADMIIADG